MGNIEFGTGGMNAKSSSKTKSLNEAKSLDKLPTAPFRSALPIFSSSPKFGSPVRTWENGCSIPANLSQERWSNSSAVAC